MQAPELARADDRQNVFAAKWHPHTANCFAS